MSILGCTRNAAHPPDAGDGTPAVCSTAPACEARCDRGDAAACVKAAGLWLEDPTRGRSLTRVMAQYEKGCALNHGGACVGSAGNPDAPPEARAGFLAKAATLLPAECARGAAASCEHLAVLHEGRDAGVEAAEAGTRARALLAKACADAEPAACHRLGSALLTGRLGARAPADGERLLEKACTAGLAGACAELGMAYNFGTVLGQDAAKARRYMQRAGALSAPVAPGLDAGSAK